MSLEARLKEARGRLTQREIADRLRASGDPRFEATDAKRIGEWENGAPRLAFYIVSAIAEATGKPLEFFVEQPTVDPDVAALSSEGDETSDAATDLLQAILAAEDALKIAEISAHELVLSLQEARDAAGDETDALSRARDLGEERGREEKPGAG